MKLSSLPAWLYLIKNRMRIPWIPSSALWLPFSHPWLGLVTEIWIYFIPQMFWVTDTYFLGLSHRVVLSAWSRPGVSGFPHPKGLMACRLRRTK